MQLKQKASADRAIAREQRVQEEEQRLLAIAKGDREVAERQAAAKVEQIAKTTEAETLKQLALTEAAQKKESAEIDKQTAQINLDKARIDAKAVKVLADAEAYKKEAVLKADNALAQKLDAEVEIQRLWADAYAKRAVPTNVFGASGGDTPVGGDGEVQNFMRLLTLDAANRLSYERDVATK
jgi:membrane protein involved in colicin uptake